ncbi:hypothetical protein BD324DRAFT_638618 [Kockovaella imperatae]|uniref:Uncharacterized protein n=1 Tax=Kockovaella imperatae TaxID=4999 RepID=A0A1Y1U8F7_9TREE|nr:hypothetical protein BD324DRAFT_638618 [Kockovaella imperatae]ORX33796.1 hypothetical protein BD324DRAFT_638618 [Kockovaella imperatae]
MSTEKKGDGVTTFEPIHPFDMSDPKSWAKTIGMMNWDNDKIVFSKRSLLEFLKACDLTVNTNFTEIQKLPKFATFGRLNKEATDAAVADLVEAEIADPTTDSSVHPSKSTVPRTTRKVTEPPGGRGSFRLAPQEYEETDALSLAPPRDGGDGVDVELDHMEHLRLHVEPEHDGGAKIEDEKAEATPAAASIPSRPSVAGLFGDNADGATESTHGRRKQTQAPQEERRGFW